jgi:methylmalonyl-CoA mutase cobalamin-binding subunit
MGALGACLLFSPLKLLSQELEKRELKGEILIVGGSAMVIAFKARIATKDIDAIFEPKSKIYEISKNIAKDQDRGGRYRYHQEILS